MNVKSRHESHFKTAFILGKCFLLSHHLVKYLLISWLCGDSESACNAGYVSSIPQSGKTHVKKKNWNHGIWSQYFMANRRGKVETVTYFLFLGSIITVDDDCRYQRQRSLLLGQKTMTNIYSIAKNRDITLSTLSNKIKFIFQSGILLTKFHVVKAMVFPVVVYGCETWIIKKAEC